MTTPNFLFNNLLPGLAAWTVLYISDYTLTLKCAKLYRSGVSDKIAFEGSFELNPNFQADIDSLRTWSPRFLAALLVSGVWLTIIWWLSWGSQPGLYQFALGALILIQLAIHIRHLRNLFLFRVIVSSNAVEGRISYSRQVVLRMSAVEIFAFSALYLVLFAFTQSWFVLGGALACLALALKHLRLGQKYVSGQSTPTNPNNINPQVRESDAK
jgi:hypothetical protein